MSLRSAYDSWHRRLHDADPEHDDASSPWYQLVSEYIGDVAGLRILEVACGRGGLVKQMVRGGAHVTGCDFSTLALRAASSKLLKLEGPSPAVFVQGDAQSLPFAEGSFDIVISCETIEHLPKVQNALSEMHRVTCVGGRLFLTTPNYFNFMGLYEVYSHFRHPTRQDGQPFDRRQWFPQVHNWVRKAGWTVVDYDGTVHQFPFIPGRNPVRWNSLEERRAVRRFLSPFALTYFIAALKSSPTKKNSQL